MTTDGLKLVHTTDRERFKKCRLQWHFSSPLQLSYQPLRKPGALLFGTAWHKALEVIYEPSTPPDFAVAKVVFQKNLAANLPENPDIELEAEYSEHLRMGLSMLEGYERYVRPQDRGLEVVEVERGYLIEVEGYDGYAYTLQPDAIVKDRDGRHWIMEHKSADKLPEQTDYLLMDEQCGAYLWGVYEATGLKCEGVIYTIARKKIPGKMKLLKGGHLSVDKSKITTTYEYAKEQISAHYDGDVPWNRYLPFLEALKTQRNPFFLRLPVRRNKSEIDFLSNMIKVELSEMTNPDVPIYRNPNRFNCSTCPFIGPCLSYYEGGDYMSMLEGNYEKSDYR